MNKQMVCPMCGWEVEPIDDANIALCRKCREWIVAEPEDNLLWPPDEDLPGDDEQKQEMYEADSWNYGVDDNK
jgi:ribosome-binding protein aMBF1 (putative translation factor)